MNKTPPEALFEVGLAYPGANICKSSQHMLLMSLMTEHAQDMADYEKLGHQNFQSRWDECHQKLGISCAEIAAMSWADRSDEDLDKIAKQMWDSWRSSPGHWKIARQEYKFVGGDMAKSSKGIWYACVIAGS
jgi:uncharacterized protein YkwD